MQMFKALLAIDDRYPGNALQFTEQRMILTLLLVEQAGVNLSNCKPVRDLPMVIWQTLTGVVVYKYHPFNGQLTKAVGEGLKPKDVADALRAGLHPGGLSSYSYY